MKCAYLDCIISRETPIHISHIHSRLFHGWYHGQKIGGPRARYVATNVDAPVVHPSVDLIVAPPILEAFRRIRPLDAQPTDILAAFSHPADPADGLEERFSNVSTSAGTDNALYNYLKKHATKVEKPTLFDVYPVRGRVGKSRGPVVHTVAKGPIPRKELRYYSIAEIVFGDLPSNNAPIDSRDLDFVPQRLEEYGVVKNWGHVFLPEMFEVIAPYVVGNPYFYVEEFEV